MNLLLQGDCLELMTHIPDQSVDMILCDLPYGTTACKWDTVIPFEPLWEQYKRVIKDNGAIVLTASQPFTSALVMSNIKMFKYEWIWVKNCSGFMNAKKMPLKNYEDICVFYKKLCKYNPVDLIRIDKKITMVERTDKSVYGKMGIIKNKGKEYTQEFTNYPKQVLNFPSEKGFHPTQKPLALFEYLIKTYTNEGDTVMDNCMGSGTTGVACANLNRSFIGMEKDPGYFETARNRIYAQLGTPVEEDFLA